MTPLVFVRTRVVYPVPPVPTIYWTPADWARIATRIVEPLVIDALGFTWIATGDRDAQGRLLYRVAAKEDR